jgi:Domain of unknown function (DUF4386)
MTQNLPQFIRPLFRIGSILFIAGMVITIVSTVIHASTEDPSNHPLVFTIYASDDSWIAVHIGQLLGAIMVFGGGFVVLYRLVVQSESESSITSVLAWIGLALTIMTASAVAVLQAVDGIAQKKAVDSYVAAPPEEKSITFKVAEGIRFIEYGTNSIFRIFQGLVAVIFGVAIVKSKILNKWIGVAGVIMGAVTIYAGLEVAYLGFGGLTTIIGISWIVYFIWTGTLGGFMWKKSMSRENL